MLDLAEQIGFGTMKLYKYCKAYGGSEPSLLDENHFEFILPIDVFEVKHRVDNNIEFDKEVTKMNPKSDQDELMTPQEHRKHPTRTPQDMGETNDKNSRIIKTQGDDNPIRIPHKNPTRTTQDVILNFCEKKPKSLEEIMKLVNLKDKKSFKSLYLNPLLQQHKLSMTIPDKPTSRYQKYITMEGGK